MKTNAVSHTPGPWSEHDGFIIAKFSDGLVHDICDPRCAPAELTDELEANARLIASAPELLAALEAIDRQAIHVLGSMANAEQCHLARALVQPLLNARMAIAKAAGK